MWKGPFTSRKNVLAYMPGTKSVLGYVCLDGSIILVRCMMAPLHSEYRVRRINICFGVGHAQLRAAWYSCLVEFFRRTGPLFHHLIYRHNTPLFELRPSNQLDSFAAICIPADEPVRSTVFSATLKGPPMQSVLPDTTRRPAGCSYVSPQPYGQNHPDGIRHRIGRSLRAYIDTAGFYPRTVDPADAGSGSGWPHTRSVARLRRHAVVSGGGCHGDARLQSAGSWGIAQLLGPTAGFLLSFPLAAAAAGGIVRAVRLGGSRFFAALLAGSAATLLFFAMGAGWLAHLLHLSPNAAWHLAVAPFLPGEMIKVCAVAAAYTLLHRWHGTWFHES